MTWRAPPLHNGPYKKFYNFNISILTLIIFQINLSYSLKYIMKYVSALIFHWKMKGRDCLRTFGTTHVKRQFCVTKFISCHKIHFLSQNWVFVTKFNSVSQKSINWILCHKIEFCVTKLNFVSQNSILSHKSQFCVTKLIFVSQNTILCNKSQILCHKNQICLTEFNSVSQNSILCYKIQFCDTKLNSVYSV